MLFHFSPSVHQSMNVVSCTARPRDPRDPKLVFCVQLSCEGTNITRKIWALSTACHMFLGPLIVEMLAFEWPSGFHKNRTDTASLVHWQGFRNNLNRQHLIRVYEGPLSLPSCFVIVIIAICDKSLYASWYLTGRKISVGLKRGFIS
jgi:hypothetical protein